MDIYQLMEIAVSLSNRLDNTLDAFYYRSPGADRWDYLRRQAIAEV